MNKLTLLLMVLVLMPGVLAGSTAYGYINIEIINKEPVLENLRLSTDIVYYDTDVDCLAKVIDNDPEEALINKRWEVNGKEVDKLNMQEGDEVKCLLVPIDKWGLEGAEYSLSFKVQNSLSDIKIVQSFYKLLGNDPPHTEVWGIHSRKGS